MENIKTYCLFEGRHELPSNLGPICSSFDFEAKEPVRTELWDEATTHDGTVKLYVTGLTPALTQFLSDRVADSSWMANARTFLYHYDSATGEYWEQQICC
jgi:hypothetical protein